MNVLYWISHSWNNYFNTGDTGNIFVTHGDLTSKTFFKWQYILYIYITEAASQLICQRQLFHQILISLRFL